MCVKKKKMCDLESSVKMKIQTLIELGKSVDFTIISNVSKKMKGREEIENKDLELSCTRNGECDYKAPEKNVLANHTQAKHNVVKSNLFQTLVEIGKSVDFTITSNVSKKIEIQEELELSCTQCDYKATDKKVLANHNQVKHNVVMSGLHQTLEEVGKSVDFTISSNVSRKMESQEGLKHEALELSPEKHDLESQNKAKHHVVTCDLCNYSTKRNPELIMHKRAKHEGLRYSCSLCDHKAVYKHSLKRHTETKHGDKRHLCGICGYSAGDSYVLKLHKESRHEGQRYHCPKCDYQATQKRFLTRHTLSKHEGMRYDCNLCEFQAPRKDKLNMHIQSIHNGVRFGCDICKYEATKKENLTQHKKSKHGGLLYHCNQCDVKTVFRSSLLKHQQSKHK